MRTNERSLSALASALLLAASAAAVSGCANRSLDATPPKPTVGPNNVTVIVDYDKATNTQTWYSSQGLPDPDKTKPVELSESNKDTVAWFPGGDAFKIEIEPVWDPKRPFDKDPEPDPTSKKVLKSGPPRGGSAKHGEGKECTDHTNTIVSQCYKYKAWLWFHDQGKDDHREIDPRIVIMP